MPEFHGWVRNDGSIDLGHNRTAFAQLRESLKGKEIVIDLREKFNKADIEHLRGYFHAAVLPRIARAAGYSCTPHQLEHVKKGLKERFLTIPAAPGETPQVRSTESLSPSEYYQFIFECRQYAAETLHVDIEDPR